MRNILNDKRAYCSYNGSGGLGLIIAIPIAIIILVVIVGLLYGFINLLIFGATHSDFGCDNIQLTCMETRNVNGVMVDVLSNKCNKKTPVWNSGDTPLHYGLRYYSSCWSASELKKAGYIPMFGGLFKNYNEYKS